MFPSTADVDFARRHIGRVTMLAAGAAISLALATAIDVPSVKAIDSSVTGVFGGWHGETAPSPRNLVAGERLADILDQVKDGQTVVWRNPDTRVTYRIHPLATFKAGESDCRTFTIRRIADSGLRESYRTACLGADGTWTISPAPQIGPNG